MSSSQNNREQAEAAFSKAMTQTLSRTRLNLERDDFNAARDAKTLRLRELRREKDANDALALAAAPPARRKRAR